MDTQREEVRAASLTPPPVFGAAFDCFGVSAGASVARQRLLSEVRAAVLLEHQADVGQQDPRSPAGKGASGGRRPLRPPSVTRNTCVSAAPLQEVRKGRVWEMQFQTLPVPHHGLRVPRADVRRLL